MEVGNIGKHHVNMEVNKVVEISGTEVSLEDLELIVNSKNIKVKEVNQGIVKDVVLEIILVDVGNLFLNLVFVNEHFYLVISNFEVYVENIVFL